MAWQDLSSEIAEEFGELGARGDAWQGVMDGTLQGELVSGVEGGAPGYAIRGAAVSVRFSWGKDEGFDLEDQEAMERERASLEQRRQNRIVEDRRLAAQARAARAEASARFRRRQLQYRLENPKRCATCKRVIDPTTPNYSLRLTCSARCSNRRASRRAEIAKRKVIFDLILKRTKGYARCMLCRSLFAPKKNVAYQRFCCAEHRRWHYTRSRARANARRAAKTCQHCGKGLVHTTRGIWKKRYCGRACAVKAWHRRRLRPREDVVCAWCSCSFTPPKNSAHAGKVNSPRFCCSAHKQKHADKIARERNGYGIPIPCAWCAALFVPVRAATGGKTSPRFCCRDHRAKFHNERTSELRRLKRKHEKEKPRGAEEEPSRSLECYG